jgi:Domain of unknown function (DUF756)
VKAQATRRVVLENGQLVTKGEDLRLQRGTGPETGGNTSKKSNKKRAHHGSPMIARTIATSAFSDPTDFSVTTTGRETANVFPRRKRGVTDKGYHSGDALVEIKDMEVRTYVRIQDHCRNWDRTSRSERCSAQLQADDGHYDLWVYGPNGFVREFRGLLTKGTATIPEVDLEHDVLSGSVRLGAINEGRREATLLVRANAYCRGETAGDESEAQASRRVDGAKVFYNTSSGEIGVVRLSRFMTRTGST